VCVGPDSEELFGGLNPVTGDGLLIAVTYAGVPVVVLQVLDDELLPDVYHLVDGLVGQVDQLDCKLI
jgi:hypothetical protein